MISTVICHFYNESYLLPLWLNHHKNIFDYGILINYHSTDNSIQIIKKIVPNWVVVNSKNKMFEAQNVDLEIMEIERDINGIKICLNVTEFLLSKNIKAIFNSNSLSAFGIERITMVEKFDFYKKFSNPVWESRYFGYRGDNNINGLYRILHNYDDGQYTIGRHSTLHPFRITNDAVILWYGFSPFNIKNIRRKLQIQNNIPSSDFEKNYGSQHKVDFIGLVRRFLSQHKHRKIENLRNLFKNYT